MPLVSVVTDRAWYSVDVYEQRGSNLVKIFTKGPFQTTEPEARDVLEDTIRDNLTRKIVGHRYDARQKRWMRWP